ncbi:diflavin oxidoreductase [Vibrio penaeicida]|uniref:Sulfite reductase [NADPH] flavoprotein alpha-component n=1 Tax=Vibrio penaeicida TaxID=104609 RepID=A0AAV5NZP5_9VIBR|nr:sulfite reductase flavoprotein subunit alpha [Vibrio penaeicida]RTZ22753.1 sulfite reductase flavoprotein subunit alpha [Vibrio penaeicida]GLQ76170.1 sulfite reductase [NADPH] flavoprotein alpha-component [Vibrio penaeicida]
MKVPYLPQDIPFNDDQKTWLAGFFSGLHSRLLVKEESVVHAESKPQVKALTILYGSQTGNAEAVAYDTAEKAKEYGMTATVYDMDDVDAQIFVKSSRILIVTSTYGEGEMPDNAESLWQTMSDEHAPKLDGTFFSILALGDTSYDEFCLAGKLWDERLEELGATRVTTRVDCDIDFEQPAEEWMIATLPGIADKGDDGEATVAQGGSAPKAKSKYSRKQPLQATLKHKRVLNKEGSSKEIVHYEISLEGSGEFYKAGDALNVISQNQPELVQAFLEHFQFSGDEKPSWNGDNFSLREIFTSHLDIRTPSKEFVKALAESASDHKLIALIGNEDSKGLNDFLWGKDILDLLRQYPSVTLSLAEILSLLKPIAPRAYSISSSLNKHADEVHLTIGSVRYQNGERDYNGTCSTWLADLVEEGDVVPCYFAPNKNFAVPEDDKAPMIMVGPGTGIAPFRAFLEEREVQASPGDNWLIFGDRNGSTDFIYQEELEALQSKGVLTKLDLAFSRDQAEKIYVQDKMRESGADLYEWLERGGYFFVCGDAYYMAKDVDKALHEVIEVHGNKSKEEAEAYVNQLKKQKRYVRDVY